MEYYYNESNIEFVFDSEMSYLRARMEYLIKDLNISFSGFLLGNKFDDLSIKLLCYKYSTDPYDLQSIERYDRNYYVSSYGDTCIFRHISTINYEDLASYPLDLDLLHLVSNPLDILRNAKNFNDEIIDENKKNSNKEIMNKDGIEKEENKPFNRFEYLDLR